MSNATQEALAQLKQTLELLTLQQQSGLTNSKGQTTQNELNDVTHNSAQQSKDYFKECSQNYLDFTYESPTIYHVVEYFSKKLDEAGFTYLSEKAAWNEVKGGKYYTVRNGTSLAAFVVDEDWKSESGVGAIGSHIDALCVKLKPVSQKDNVEGFQLLGVAPYGGTLNTYWFDRDLGIGGRVLVKDESTGKIESRLINSSPQPIAKIPSLAVHFGEPAIGPFDKEDQAVPVIGYGSVDEEEEEKQAGDLEDESQCPLYGKHPIGLLRFIAGLTQVKVSQIVQLDLDLFDVQKGTFGGLKNEFLFAPRIDDRICSFSAIQALIDFAKEGSIPSGAFNVVTLYDNEEVGSLSRQGAKGGLLESVVQRVAANLHGDHPSIVRTAFANSIVLSADVNHMFNPNFKSVYMEHHRPKPNVGVTLSLDSNLHMSTDVVGVALAEELARINGDKIQYFQIKNNSRSGGTIGPSIASQTGARTIDLGIAQLAMHSIRAVTGSKDVGLAIKFFKGFFTNWRSVYDKFGDL
ncbi:LAME_0G16556g1_1 [Lachancea meyersii CBS 8951]|uniref:LAME_0G16556g1_1 n=1 Tax=Lachancea meyersii CBS 8951 TaxID=1266667 RepID=A0A1G4KBE4_9SACH|nr:LAME_0G16556g1_1 [Lachancea meyersii CBS 8951]